MSSSTRERRKPVSFRIPLAELSKIEDYAAEQRISKSDALLYFLTKGIDADRGISLQLDAIQETLNEALYLIKKGSKLQTIDEVIDSVSSVVIDFPEVEKVHIFGSFARGDATAESDIDLRFEIEEGSSFSLFDLARIKELIEKRTGREVDIITVRDIRDGKLRQAIDREAKLIYERTR